KGLTDMDLENMQYYTFEKGRFAGVDNVLVSATGYTGAGGFEIYLDNEHAEQVWKATFAAGEHLGIVPAGLGCRDTLRMDKGFCLYGNDMDDNTNPLEAGLGWVTKFTKDFVASDILKKEKEEGTKRKLIGFKMIDRGIPRQHYLLFDKDGEQIGEVTSGTSSPSLKYGIGLGYVKPEFAQVGNEIFVEVRNKHLKAEVVKLPFL